MSEQSTWRVGTDVAAVLQVADSIAFFGDRYLHRVYTEHEIACCEGVPGKKAAGLAARFAAKEATIKVLRPTGHLPEWRSIEVRRHFDGWCSLSLSGHAAELADEAGITELAVSLAHEEGMAVAFVVAVCGASPGAKSRKMKESGNG